ncbi:hypothetical protein KW797_02340 [Candidatus Parcubacteria bacterium]|nr:hypothetical protein [Candidatus Parcubacteria bacterium]
MNKAEKQAFEAGKAAKADGKGLDVMPGAYVVARSLGAAFRKGWNYVAVEVKVQTQEVRHGEPEVRTGVFLDAKAPLPEVYHKPQPVACRHCRCVRLPDGAQAVVMIATSGGFAGFQCRARGCQKWFKLRVKDGA